MLGLVRAIYAAEKADGAPPPRLNRISKVGKDLKEAITMARQATPGTLSRFAAWNVAEKASNAACDLVDVLSMAEPIVKAAVCRVWGRRR